MSARYFRRRRAKAIGSQRRKARSTPTPRFAVISAGMDCSYHSPQRIEVITSFYKHPGEMVVNSIVGSLLVYTLLGLSPAAGS
jgi:hypothetical protein